MPSLTFIGSLFTVTYEICYSKQNFPTDPLRNSFLYSLSRLLMVTDAMRLCAVWPHFYEWHGTIVLNPNEPNGISHPYHLDESIFVFRVIGSNYNFYFIFDENHVSKEKSPRWDAAFCGVASGAILFAYVPLKGRKAYMG